MSAPIDQHLHQALSAASQALQRRDAAAAERALAPVPGAQAEHPAYQNLMGLVRLMQGQFAPAAALFAKARAAMPRDPMLAYHEGMAQLGLGQAGPALAAFQAAVMLKPDFLEPRFEAARLQHQTGAFAEAEQGFRAVLARAPAFMPAAIALGAVLVDGGKAAEAETYLRQLLARTADPQVRLQVELQLSAALRRQRKDLAALEICDRVQSLAPHLPQLALHRADTLQNLGRHDEALALYEALLAQEPANAVWHHNYNELLHRLGRQDRFLQSYDRAPQSRSLLLGKAFFLLQQERAAEGLALYRQLLLADPGDTLAATGAARMLAKLGRHQEASAAFARLLAAAPDAGLYSLAAEAALLAGDPAKAASLCEQGLALSPHHGSCLAYLSLAWRMLDDARDEALSGYDSLVRVFDLEAPEGFSSMAAFNAELNAALDALHPDTEAFLGQSLRGGTQTAEHLFAIGHPLVEKLRLRIGEAVQRYIAELPQDAAHPFLNRRAKGFRYSGSWSSRLKDQGFHVNHIHPAGWISSCYYVALPEAVNDAAARQGWLKFGEPALDVPLSQPIRRAIQPAAGRLVLFPSYLWHGTIPFHDRQARTTIAFDVVPTD